MLLLLFRSITEVGGTVDISATDADTVTLAESDAGSVELS